MAFADTVTGNVSTFSSFLFVAQVFFQIKVYGLRQWWKLGLGMGVESERSHVEHVIKDAESEAHKLTEGWEHPGH